MQFVFFVPTRYIAANKVKKYLTYSSLENAAIENSGFMLLVYKNHWCLRSHTNAFYLTCVPLQYHLVMNASVKSSLPGIILFCVGFNGIFHILVWNWSFSMISDLENYNESSAFCLTFIHSRLTKLVSKHMRLLIVNCLWFKGSGDFWLFVTNNNVNSNNKF